MIALAPREDVTQLAADYAADGRVRIPDFLAPESAQALSDWLLASEAWRHVVHGNGRVFEIARADLEAMPAEQRAPIDAAVIAAGRHGFQYRYDTIRVADDATARHAAGRPIDAFALAMSAPETLALLAQITGTDDVTFADSQATAYRPGDFLTQHDDAVPGKGRRAAYVLGLSEGWRREWGGQLLYHDGEDRAVACNPGFNTLDLFRVPQSHSVSYVAPLADRPRLSITGWLRAT